ncbi:MAG TPA: glycosyltransferase 61 family protein [Acetobacteraceae bacterium]
MSTGEADPAPTGAAEVEPAGFSGLEDGLDAAHDAFVRNDMATAQRIWQELRARFPDHPTPLHRAGAGLLDRGRLEEAEDLLSEGRDRFPNDLPIATDFAWVAWRGGRYEAATERWGDVRHDFPQAIQGWVGGGLALRELRRYDEAERLLGEAIERFPDTSWPAAEHAVLANVQGHWEEALRRWDRVRQRFRQEPQGVAGAAWALRELGRLAEAEQLLKAGTEQFPEHPNIAIEHATVAHQRQDWAAAADRWERVRRILPQERRAYLLGAEALGNAGRHEAAEALLRQAAALSDEQKVTTQSAATGGRRLTSGAGAPARLTLRPLERITVPVQQLLRATTIDMPACLVHTNMTEFDWDFGRHLLATLYTPRSCRLAVVQLRRFRPSAWVAVPTGEDLIPVCDGLVPAEQVNPGWDASRLRDAVAGCGPEVEVDRAVVVLGRYGLRTWGHWLGELLPKVACLERFSPGQFSYGLPADVLHDAHLRTARESLRFHGVDDDRVVALEVGRRYRFRELFAVSPVWSDRMIHPGAVERMRQAVPVQPRGDRVALLRRESATRRVANLDELRPLLEAANIRTVEIGELPFSAQVTIFQRADVVISVLGSGLTGLIYSPPGVKVVTLSPIGWADDFFFALMQNRSARLAEIRGPSANDDPRGVGVSSFTVPPAALQRGLRALGLSA